MMGVPWSKLLAVFLVWFCVNACAHAPVSDTSRAGSESCTNDVSGQKVLIVYQSKYGSTRQYAEWLHSEISGDLVNVEKENKPAFAEYDIIVFGSYIRTGRIVIAPLILESWSNIRGKKVVLFTVSGTPPTHPSIQQIFSKGFPEEIRKEIRYFPLRGRLVSQDLSFFDKLLVAIGRIMEKDEAMRKIMREDFDDVERDNLAPVSAYIKTLMFQK